MEYSAGKRYNMNKEKKERETRMSMRQKLCAEGVIAAQYTQNGWFVKVKPAFSINKVIFSFVMKGKAGDGFDIYMDLDRFDNWVDDIQSRILLRVLAEEKAANEQYPKNYKYVTGENGEKSVGICNSSKGASFVINGCTVKDGAKVYANVPVDFDWLRTMAKYYRRCVESEGVFENYAKTLMEAANAYHQNVPKDQETEHSEAEEPAPQEKPAAPSPAQEKPEGKQSPSTVSVTVFTDGEFTDTKDGGSYILAKTQDDDSCYVVFSQDLIKSLGKRYDLMKTSIRSGKSFRMKVTGEEKTNSKGVKSLVAEKIS